MTLYTGRNGSMKVGSTFVEKVRDWSLETTVELLSTNTIDSGVNTFVPGIKGATGSATLLYYQAGSTNFKDILSKILKTSEITTRAPKPWGVNLNGLANENELTSKSACSAEIASSSKN